MLQLVSNVTDDASRVEEEVKKEKIGRLPRKIGYVEEGEIL